MRFPALQHQVPPNCLKLFRNQFVGGVLGTLVPVLLYFAIILSAFFTVGRWGSIPQFKISTMKTAESLLGHFSRYTPYYKKHSLFCGPGQHLCILIVIKLQNKGISFTEISLIFGLSINILTTSIYLLLPNDSNADQGLPTLFEIYDTELVQLAKRSILF